MTQAEFPTLKEQLIAELANLKPQRLADLHPLKLKYRNLCNARQLEELAIEQGFVKAKAVSQHPADRPGKVC